MFTYKPCNAAPHPEKQALRHMEMIRHDQLWPSCHLQEIRYDFVSNLFSSYIMRKKKRDRIGPVIRTSVSLPDKSVTCCILRPKLIRSDTCSGVSLDWACDCQKQHLRWMCHWRMQRHELLRRHAPLHGQWVQELQSPPWAPWSSSSTDMTNHITVSWRWSC